MTNSKKVAIIGGGPAGIMAAITAKETSPELNIEVFEKNKPLQTLLYTGGGRCNLAYYEFDNKELASNFPRGEKFLYSVFNQFSTGETLEFFNKIGVETYIQDDNRIFPTSDKANEVRRSLIKHAGDLGIKIHLNTEIKQIKKEQDSFFINDKKFDKLVISTGGRYKDIKNTGFYFAQQLGHTITNLNPSLCGLCTKEKWAANISGVSLQNIEAKITINDKKIATTYGDLLFTHSGISGPLTYKISSLCALENYNSQNPIKIQLNLINQKSEAFEEKLIQVIKDNSKKSIINNISKFITRSLALALLEANSITPEKQSAQINKEERKKIIEFMTALKLQATKPAKDGEIVTAGGIKLDEINPKTMESKLVKNLYFCGEVLDIDGFTGGFNLQNCWSTGYIAGKSL